MFLILVDDIQELLLLCSLIGEILVLQVFSMDVYLTDKVLDTAQAFTGLVDVVGNFLGEKAHGLDLFEIVNLFIGHFLAVFDTVFFPL